MSVESIKNTGSKSTFAPKIIDNSPLPLAKFSGNCLSMSGISLYQKAVNLYISYIIDACPRDLNANFTPGNCLFGAVELTKNADPDKYSYSGYGIGFESRSKFSLPDSGSGKNIIIFRVDNSSSVHIAGKNKNILVKDQRKATITTDIYHY